METVNTFATFITNLATLALVVGVLVTLMRVVGWVIQTRVQRRRIVALKAEYGTAGVAGRPIAPPSDKRSYRRAA